MREAHAACRPHQFGGRGDSFRSRPLGLMTHSSRMSNQTDWPSGPKSSLHSINMKRSECLTDLCTNTAEV